MQFLYQIVWTNILALILFISSDYDIKRHMGTSTEYPIFTDKQQELTPPDNCKLENLFLVARHGTRYPEESEIEKFDELGKVFQNVSSKHKVIFTKKRILL
jgi:hypothetical protein